MSTTNDPRLPGGIQAVYKVDGLPGEFGSLEAALAAQETLRRVCEVAAFLANDPHPAQHVRDAAARLVLDPVSAIRLLCPELIPLLEVQRARKGALRVVTLNPPRGAVVWVLEDDHREMPSYTTQTPGGAFLTLPWDELPALRWEVAL